MNDKYTGNYYYSDLSKLRNKSSRNARRLEKKSNKKA